MAEISNRAVATAAGGALLGVALAFVGKADAQQYDRAVRCNGKIVRVAAARDELDRGTAIDHRSLRLSADRRTVLWRNGDVERAAAID